MQKKSVIFFLIILCIIFTVSCSKETEKLPDLGGIHSYNFDDLDFKVEISGAVLGKSIKSLSGSATDVFASNSINNKVLSWGLKRNPGKFPDANPGAPELIARYNGKYLGDVNQKRIYLTFDEGYENGYTSKILDILKINNVKALFFITGPYLKEHTELVRRMIEEGHNVGNHTISHKSLPYLGDSELEEEIAGLDRAFYEKFGKNMMFLRPPMGEYSERSLYISSRMGYVNVFWSLAYDDWYRDKQRGPDYAFNIVTENLHNGAVILLHAVSKDNAMALERIIKEARNKNFIFGNPDELA